MNMIYSDKACSNLIGYGDVPGPGLGFYPSGYCSSFSINSTGSMTYVGNYFDCASGGLMQYSSTGPDTSALSCTTKVTPKPSTNPTMSPSMPPTIKPSNYPTMAPTMSCTKMGNVYMLQGQGSAVLTCNSASSPTSSPAKSCFAGSEVVTLESGESKLISNVQVGDRVLAADAKGNQRFSEVIYVPHMDNRDKAHVNQITTVSGRDIKLTADHMIFASAACDASYALAAAGKVAVGSCLQTVDGAEKVVSNKVIEAHGLFSIVLKEEFVVVNGVVASPFATNHAVTNAFYNVYRALYDIAPALMQLNVVKAATEVFGALVTSA